MPWDPKIGAAAGEMDFFIRYLVMTLLANLQAKALRCTKDPDPVAQAKSFVFVLPLSQVSKDLGTLSVADN